MSEPLRFKPVNPAHEMIYSADGGWVSWEDYARLKAEVERLTERLGGVRLIVTEEMYDELNTKYLEQQHELQNIALTARQILDEKIDLKEQVERLTKAVMHSPAAQLKLKELEGKTTFEEINPKEAENARLKAEVERLEEDNRQLTNAFEIAEGIIKRMGKAAEAAAKEGKSSV
jgi:DNA repair exonuclease SbcCD ATPase subunit